MGARRVLTHGEVGRTADDETQDIIRQLIEGQSRGVVRKQSTIEPSTVVDFLGHEVENAVSDALKRKLNDRKTRLVNSTPFPFKVKRGAYPGSFAGNLLQASLDELQENLHELEGFLAENPSIFRLGVQEYVPFKSKLARFKDWEQETYLYMNASIP
jgi:hypothetical protein